MDKFDFQHAMTGFFGNQLDLIDCDSLSDELLLHIVHHCEPLRRLYIKGCPEITVEGLKNMITEWNRLVAEAEDGDEGDGDTDSESILEIYPKDRRRHRLD